MVKGKIIAIGSKAQNEEEKMLLFFNQSATTTLKEYSVIQEIDDVQGLDLAVGNTIFFGEQEYQIAYVGNTAVKTLQSIAHVTFIFEEPPQENPVVSGVYLTPSQLPEIFVGLEISYP
ncbi:MAG: PTS glucitol/sorbitol transporter subunit IIA [Enterococcus sp.]